ncbi:DUF6364 family protein [Paracidovorax sp. MALMAid1276]|uniref:DUF6364 family protein n=1 Tax=Paracidovorax sp. MALMAid1276 TaxID=3411631 RepID=UPI003B9C8655
MTNLTISLDDAIVKKARVRAIQEGTSLSAKVREFLAAYSQSPLASGPAQTTDPAGELLALMARVRAEAQPEASAQPTTPQTLREQTYADGFRQQLS